MKKSVESSRPAAALAYLVINKLPSENSPDIFVDDVMLSKLFAPGGPTGPGSTIFFSQTATPQPIALTGAETTVLTTGPVPVVAGQTLKIDTTVQITAVSTANSTLSYNINVRRNGVLLTTTTVQRSLAIAGTAIFVTPNTYVDTAPATGSNTYTVGVMVTDATNITSLTAMTRANNVVRFP
ncbi:hypothetical protein [Brevibacillus fulvus]|uniref:Uncharacterized protein n=1 Tax=Brevibacillus fulvus TaxID=1125967 RepID=A0A938XVT7_9BACL|nr:hypothetical protein [Brevibacillus fulvus]MBM7589029.1 hypothetical protein [Brevibacillus fulvus]